MALGLSARDLLAGRTRRISAERREARTTMQRYPDDVIAQAEADRRHGLEDTDCRVLDQSSLQHCPRPL